jgi:hypothetical protein
MALCTSRNAHKVSFYITVTFKFLRAGNKLADKIDEKRAEGE